MLPHFNDQKHLLVPVQLQTSSERYSKVLKMRYLNCFCLITPGARSELLVLPGKKKCIQHCNQEI